MKYFRHKLPAQALAVLVGLLVLGGCSTIRAFNHLSDVLDVVAGEPVEDEAHVPVVGYAGPAPEAVEEVYYGRLPAEADPARPRACFFRVEGARHVVLAGDPLYGALMPQHPDYAEYLAIDGADLSEEDRALCAAHWLTRDLADFRALSAHGGARPVFRMMTVDDSAYLSPALRAHVLRYLPVVYPWLRPHPVKTAPRRDLVFASRRMQDERVVLGILFDSQDLYTGP